MTIVCDMIAFGLMCFVGCLVCVVAIAVFIADIILSQK